MSGKIILFNRSLSDNNSDKGENLIRGSSTLRRDSNNEYKTAEWFHTWFLVAAP
jgi:hypothetical protein